MYRYYSAIPCHACNSDRVICSGSNNTGTGCSMIIRNPNRSPIRIVSCHIVSDNNVADQIGMCKVNSSINYCHMNTCTPVRNFPCFFCIDIYS